MKTVATRKRGRSEGRPRFFIFVPLTRLSIPHEAQPAGTAGKLCNLCSGDPFQ